MSGGFPKLSGGTRTRQLVGDGTWGWSADVVGDDIVIRGASGTWFGGDDDPLDNGETASGVRTKGNPGLVGFSLPMDGRSKSTKGSPIPALPWHTPITVSNGEVSVTGPLIDVGPAKSARDQVDMTRAAFVQFAPLRVGVVKGLTITIHGGAKFL